MLNIGNRRLVCANQRLNSLNNAEEQRHEGALPVITVRHVTKKPYKTTLRRLLPLVLNQIRSVAAFTPIFRLVFYPMVPRVPVEQSAVAWWPAGFRQKNCDSGRFRQEPIYCFQRHRRNAGISPHFRSVVITSSPIARNVKNLQLAWVVAA